MNWVTDPHMTDGTVSIWDPSSVIYLQGPIRTATYRDEHESGIQITDASKVVDINKLPKANGGHIITTNNLGHITVYCKKTFIKKGNNRIPIPAGHEVIVTSNSVDRILCPTCMRVVKVREKYMNETWFAKPFWIRGTGSID